jgi:hypothetical protein
MASLRSLPARSRRSFFLLAGAIAAALAGTAEARQLPQNVGYGLDTLIQRDLARGPVARPQDEGYTVTAAEMYAERAITDARTGRVLVDIVLNGRMPLDAVQAALTAQAASLSVVAVDRKYRRTGIIEGYVSIEDAAAIAQANGVRAVFLALKPDVDSVVPQALETAPPATNGGDAPQAVPGQPLTKIGTAFDQGVTQHRIDRINRIYNPDAPVNWDGSGISIAAMSDSYAQRNVAPTAADDVAHFDLPGAAGNPINTQAVSVLVDGPAGSSDEGRAMVQILHKMAPRARLGFASGALGEVEFAESIRQLAALPGHAGVGDFKADVIVDDISYGGEPFYGETIIGNAIDEVTAAGVTYFSSAGNNIGINAYESDLRIVPNGVGMTAATNVALAGTNIDLTGVPPELYAGGFHNFNPNAGQLDVAQLVNFPTLSSVLNSQSTEMQWDDPYDQRDLVANEPPIYTNTGTIGGAVTSVTFDSTSTPPLPTLNHGTPYIIKETATSGDLDGILQVYDANNNLLLSQDTGTDEVAAFYPPTTGQFRIKIVPFGTTTGSFNFTVNTAQGTAGVTTDLNLLAFRADTGAYISTVSLTANNLATNRPVEQGKVGSPAGQTQMQFVIARANTPPSGVQLPTRVRWQARSNGGGGFGPAEYFTYNAVTTKGHATAKGCNGTAAYSAFRPNTPEYFTSPGPATILFDKDANRLATPEIRQVPRVAATDAANTSFFTSDSSADPDTNPNFGGTSAAAPHAAAIAALVLQSRGGPGSITPDQVRTILQNSAFPHDLDPGFASGTTTTSDGGTVTLTITSDNEANAATGANDPESFKLSYQGAGSIASITFNPGGSAATAGNVSGGNNGVLDSGAGQVTYFENDFPGLVFQPASIAFKLGSLVGLTASDVTAPSSTAPYAGFSNLAGAPSNGSTHFWTMTIGFPTGQFTAGKEMHFTVGRGAQHSAVTGNSGTVGPGTTTSNPLADLFGGGVFLPRGTVLTDGMTFSGTTTGGGTFSGVIRNQIGQGYTRVDGHGLINAEAAVDRIFANGFE